MVNYKDVSIIYDHPAFPPEGIKMGLPYNIIKKDNIFYVKHQDIEVEISKELIQILFKPQSKNIKIEDVDFNNDGKLTKHL